MTTHLIVAADFLDEHPDVVARPHRRARPSRWTSPTGIAAEASGHERRHRAITTKPLADETIAGAWENLSFTLDPIASSLQESADDAIAVGLLDPVDLATPASTT